jgi:hypothetical protein
MGVTQCQANKTAARAKGNKEPTPSLTKPLVAQTKATRE